MASSDERDAAWSTDWRVSSSSLVLGELGAAAAARSSFAANRLAAARLAATLDAVAATLDAMAALLHATAAVFATAARSSSAGGLSGSAGRLGRGSASRGRSSAARGFAAARSGFAALRLAATIEQLVAALRLAARNGLTTRGSGLAAATTQQRRLSAAGKHKQTSHQSGSHHAVLHGRFLNPRKSRKDVTGATDSGLVSPDGFSVVDRRLRRLRFGSAPANCWHFIRPIVDLTERP